MKYYTIGMAGHIDHGKTTLTKALSGVDTDTLKEEKARKITIEPGFAPFPLTDEIQTSIIDVPGHEKLIRQMIAGVVGIDLVLLVIAGDEGVMQQTREHFEILSFLGVQNGMIVVTKSEKIDDEMKELLTEEIEELKKGTSFEPFKLYFVDSLTHFGIAELKTALIETLISIKTRSSKGSFRMPIDHIFTVKGQGTVIRGTIFDGELFEGDELEIQPTGDRVKVRKLQVHKTDVKKAVAGQRAAVNVTGGRKENWKRGDVLLSPNQFSITNKIDLLLSIGTVWTGKLKQRSLVKFYTGTAEVMGKIVFFDRNELEPTEDKVFCQVHLNDPVVVKREDKFILRRPSPEETIGGGEVIDPNASHYRFGDSTVKMLKNKWKGTPHERVLKILEKSGHQNLETLKKLTGLEENELIETIKTLVESKKVKSLDEDFIAISTLDDIHQQITRWLEEYHVLYPLRQGIPKAEMAHFFKDQVSVKISGKIIDSMINDGIVLIMDQYVKLPQFYPHFPEKWDKRMQNVISNLHDSGLEPSSLEVLYHDQQLPDDLYQDFKYFIEKNNMVVQLQDNIFLSRKVFSQAIHNLKSSTKDSFSVKEAKEVLNISRKYLIPFLEAVDKEGFTVRIENERKWVDK